MSSTTTFQAADVGTMELSGIVVSEVDSGTTSAITTFASAFGNTTSVVDLGVDNYNSLETSSVFPAEPPIYDGVEWAALPNVGVSGTDVAQATTQTLKFSFDVSAAAGSVVSGSYVSLAALVSGDATMTAVETVTSGSTVVASATWSPSSQASDTLAIGGNYNSVVVSVVLTDTIPANDATASQAAFSDLQAGFTSVPGTTTCTPPPCTPPTCTPPSTPPCTPPSTPPTCTPPSCGSGGSSCGGGWGGNGGCGGGWGNNGCSGGNNNGYGCGSPPTGNLCQDYGKCEQIQFCYKPSDCVSEHGLQCGIACTSGNDTCSNAFVEVTNCANAYQCGAQVYYEGNVCSGQDFTAACANGGSFSGDLYVHVFTCSQAFNQHQSACQTDTYCANGSQSVCLGDQVGCATVVGYTGHSGSYCV